MGDPSAQLLYAVLLKVALRGPKYECAGLDLGRAFPPTGGGAFRHRCTAMSALQSYLAPGSGFRGIGFGGMAGSGGGISSRTRRRMSSGRVAARSYAVTAPIECPMTIAARMPTCSMNRATSSRISSKE